MKKILLFFAIIGISNLSIAQSKNEHSKVNDAIIQLFDGIANLDMNKIQQHSTANIMVLEDGVVWNMDSILKTVNVLKTLEFSRVNKLHFIQTEVKGNTAWVVYHNKAEMIINGHPMDVRWMESAVLNKESGRWRVKLLHSTTQKEQN